jgi:hypothetical protein
MDEVSGLLYICTVKFIPHLFLMFYFFKQVYRFEVVLVPPWKSRLESTHVLNARIKI